MNLRLIACPPFTSPAPSYAPGDCWYAMSGIRCRSCECLWRYNADGTSMSLASDRQIPQPCCDNVPVVGPLTWLWWSNGDREFDIETEIAPEHRGRRPMVVVLPNGATFGLLSPTWSDRKPGSSGWRVDGDLPNVTVAPSINYDPGGSRGWHGFIQGGKLVNA